MPFFCVIPMVSLLNWSKTNEDGETEAEVLTCEYTSTTVSNLERSAANSPSNSLAWTRYQARKAAARRSRNCYDMEGVSL